MKYDIKNAKVSRHNPDGSVEEVGFADLKTGDVVTMRTASGAPLTTTLSTVVQPSDPAPQAPAAPASREKMHAMPESVQQKFAAAETAKAE